MSAICKPCDRRLHRRDHRGEAGRADRLGVPQPADMDADQSLSAIAGLMRRIAAKRLAASASLLQAHFGLRHRHVVGHVDDGVAGRPQVGEFDDAGDLDAVGRRC